ncbi:Serine/threonine-protein kinase [Agyrium rufum]|nr:Serine/threonine-protein kinase [Agyrium rufum]
MDPNKRPHLNFPAGTQFADRSYQVTNDRVYPTTPSTFPHSVFPQQGAQGQGGQNDYSHLQSPTTGGYGGANGGGYFSNSQYTSQYSQQQQQQPPPPLQQQSQSQYASQYQQQNLQSPQQTTFSPRQAGFNQNDPTATLARQFSNQNLGPGQRQGGQQGRQPSPGYARSGSTASQQAYGSHLTPTTTSGSTNSAAELQEPPPKNPEKYSPNVIKRASALHVFVESFFRDSIDRARERNTRSKELERFLTNPQYADARKKQEQNTTWRSENSYLRLLRSKESTKDYKTIKVIGKGAFGEVKLVQKKSDAKIYALKCLIKSEMFKKDQLAHVRAERDILAQADSPWVVKLYNTFQDSAFLYMLMEFLPGGDLMTMLIKYEIFTEDVTRFYMAEIILAIEAVHKLGYIHRDIKPDNILLDREGHIKLTDFGLSTGFHKQHDASYYQQLLQTTSKKPKDNRNSVSLLDQINLTVSNRGQINTWRKSRRVMAYSTVGTPDYIAPEIFSGHGYTFSCDWWSVGAIMFECLIGWPPFCAEDPHDTYRKIVDWRQSLYFPDEIQLSREAKDLITSLLCDAKDRLGHGGGGIGAQEIKDHHYFNRVTWDNLRTFAAPFKPKLSSAIDVTHFPTEDIDQSDHSAALRAQADKMNEDSEVEMSLPFIGYTYKRFDSMQ